MNLNKVQLIGRLTRDPEVRTTPSGQTVATVGLATNRNWTDKSGQTKYFNTLEAVRMHSQQKAPISAKGSSSFDDDDEIFRSLGLDVGPTKSTNPTPSDFTDDDLPFDL